MKFHIDKNKIPFLVLSVFGIILLIMAVANHYFFRTVTFDYGSYNFAFWDFAHFRVSRSTLIMATFLQDHVSFTLIYFIPIYWLFNWLTGTYTLILIQYVLIMLAAWYSFKLVMLKSKDVWLGTGTLILYFVLLGRYTTLSCDVNLAVMSACMVPIFLYFFELKKYVYAFVIFVLAMLSRENIPLWFVFIFLVLILEHYKEKKVILISSAGIILSILYFILIFKVLIPAFNTPDKQYNLFNYTALGANPAEAVSFILKHPVDATKMLFVNHLPDPTIDMVKYEFYWVYILSGGFILFLRPKYIIWFIPIIAQKMLNDSYLRWSIATYYSIEVVTLLPLSVFLVLSEFKSRHLKYALSIATCLITISVTLYKLNPKNIELYWSANPAKERIYDENFFKARFNIRKVNQLLDLIPADARVSSCDVILPHISQRQFIYMFPAVEDAEYIVISTMHDNYLLPHEANEQKRNEYLTSPQWEIIAKAYPVVLLRKLATQDEMLKHLMRIKKNAIECNFENADKGKQFTLLSNGEKADTLSKRSDSIARSGNFSLRLTQKSPFGISYHFSNVSDLRYIEVSVWRNPNTTSGYLIVSSGQDLYLVTGKSVEKDSNGWEKLQLNFVVPESVTPESLSILLWNNSSKPVYFDDFTIKKY